MNKFGERLKDLRMERNLTQTQLAKATGLSQTGIGKWELGQRTPNIDVLILCAKFFQVSADYLCGLED